MTTDHADEISSIPGCMCFECVERRVGELVMHAFQLEQSVLGMAAVPGRRKG